MKKFFALLMVCAISLQYVAIAEDTIISEVNEKSESIEITQSEENNELTRDNYAENVSYNNEDSFYEYDDDESTSETDVSQNDKNFDMSPEKDDLNLQQEFNVLSELQNNAFVEINNSIWFDSEKTRPFDTGYELYSETEFIRETEYSGNLFLSEEAYDGKFSLCLKRTTESGESTFPIKNTVVVSLKHNNSQYPKVNTISLYIKPLSGAETINFYVEDAEITESRIKIISDYNKDGDFKVGEDMSQGRWNEIKLDLTRLQNGDEISAVKNLYVSINAGSAWLIDNVSGDFHEYESANVDLGRFAKKNLMYNENKLTFVTDDSGNYNTKSVITIAKFDLSDRVSSIDISDSYIPTYVSHENSNYKNYFPDDILSNPNYWEENSKVSFVNENDVCKLRMSSGATAKLNLSSLPLYNEYKNSQSRFRVEIVLNNETTGSSIHVKLNSSQGLSLSSGNVSKGKTGVFSEIVTNNEEWLSFVPSGMCSITSLRFVKLPNVDTSATDAIPNNMLLDFEVFSDSTFEEVYGENTHFPGIDEEYTGAPIAYQSSSDSKTINISGDANDILVVRVVNPNLYSNNCSIYAGKTKYLSYGDNEYVFTGTEFEKITFTNRNQDGYPPMLVEIRKYSDTAYKSSSLHEKEVDLNGEVNYIYSKDSSKIYYVDANNYDLCIMDADSGEKRIINNVSAKGVAAVSPNGKIIAYADDDSVYCLYNIETNKKTILGKYYGITHVSDEGEYSGLKTQYQMFSSGVEGTTSISGRTYCFNDTLDLLSVVNKNKIQVQRKKNGEFEDLCSLNFGTDTVTGAVFSRNDRLFVHAKGTLWEINLDNGDKRQVGLVSGSILSVTDDNCFVFDNSSYLTLYNSDNDSRDNIYVRPDLNYGVYYDSARSRLIYTTSDSKLCTYSFIPNDRIIKGFISFDNYNWYSYKNLEWKYVGNTTMLDDDEFFDYGMSTGEISALSESDFQKLYNIYGTETTVFGISIALRFSANSDKFIPSINSVNIRTVVQNENNNIYGAHGEFFSKSDYHKINAVYPIESKPNYAENCYLIALGNECLFTYKNNNFVKINCDVDDLLADMPGNWMKIKQQGMSAVEISAIPGEKMTSLFSGTEYGNTGFTIINCIKTTGNTTKEVSVEYKLNAEKKYLFDGASGLKLHFIDGVEKSISGLSSEDIQQFFTWLEKRQSGIGSIYYVFDVSGNKFFVNYYSIQSVEVL